MWLINQFCCKKNVIQLNIFLLIFFQNIHVYNLKNERKHKAKISTSSSKSNAVKNTGQTPVCTRRCGTKRGAEGEQCNECINYLCALESALMKKRALQHMCHFHRSSTRLTIRQPTSQRVYGTTVSKRRSQNDLLLLRHLKTISFPLSLLLTFSVFSEVPHSEDFRSFSPVKMLNAPVVHQPAYTGSASQGIP